MVRTSPSRGRFDDGVDLAPLRRLARDEKVLKPGDPLVQVGQLVRARDVEELCEERSPDVHVPPPEKNAGSFVRTTKNCWLLSTSTYRVSQTVESRARACTFSLARWGSYCPPCSLRASCRSRRAGRRPCWRCRSSRSIIRLHSQDLSIDVSK